MCDMKQVTLVTGEIPVRRPAGRNTALSHINILDGRNVSEVNVFEIKLSVCAFAQFSVTKYHTVALKINGSMNSAEGTIPGCQETVVPLC